MTTLLKGCYRKSFYKSSQNNCRPCLDSQAAFFTSNYVIKEEPALLAYKNWTSALQYADDLQPSKDTILKKDKPLFSKRSGKSFQPSQKKVRVIDIGHSGLKTYACIWNQFKKKPIKLTPESMAKPDYNNFLHWLGKEGLFDSDYYGVSVPGIVNSIGEVKFSHVTGWQNRKLQKELHDYLHKEVVVLNDAEAHLLAHFDFNRHPQMCIALGTSLGFATTDKMGRLFRAGDCANFEVGQIPLVTRAKNKQVWWALGSEGLKELQQDQGEVDGAKQFGYRLGNFLATLVALYRPSTVYLSGGLADKWGQLFLPMVKNELEKNLPDWLIHPKLSLSPYGRQAGLVGLLKHFFFYS